jgi:hypothetical protein
MVDFPALRRPSLCEFLMYPGTASNLLYLGGLRLGITKKKNMKKPMGFSWPS